jgi:hypothetical protein
MLYTERGKQLGVTDRKHDATHHRKIRDASMNLGAYIQALFSDIKTFVLRQYALILQFIQPNLIFFLSLTSLSHALTHSLTLSSFTHSDTQTQ